MKNSIYNKSNHNLSSNTKLNSFSVLTVPTLILLSLAFVNSSLVFSFPSILATSSNSNDGDESNTNEASNEEDVTLSYTSNQNQQKPEGTTDEDLDASGSNEALSAESSIPGEDNNAQLLTDSTNTLVPVKPDPNLENSPGLLRVIMNVECKSTNGLPSDEAVCDMFTIEPEFIQPKDYSLTLDVARDGTSYESTFSGDSEDQTFTIKPGDFEISGVLHRDANDVVAKIGAYSQLDGVNLASSAFGDCNLINIPPGNVYGELKVKGTILPLTDSTCTINLQVNYYNIELPKSSFGDMLQNQRMPDAVIQN